MRSWHRAARSGCSREMHKRHAARRARAYLCTHRRMLHARMRRTHRAALAAAGARIARKLLRAARQRRAAGINTAQARARGLSAPLLTLRIDMRQKALCVTLKRTISAAACALRAWLCNRGIMEANVMAGEHGQAEAIGRQTMASGGNNNDARGHQVWRSRQQVYRRQAWRHGRHKHGQGHGRISRSRAAISNINISSSWPL